MATEFIVMTASAKSAPYSVYKKVAVLEVERGVKPKMISERARGVVRIVALRDKLHYGNGGARTQFAKAYADAQRLCAALKREARIVEAAHAHVD